MYIDFICLAILVFGFSLRHLVKDTNQLKQAVTPQSLLQCSLKKYDWISMTGVIISIEITAISIVSYQLPVGVLQSPLVYIPLVLLSVSIVILIHRLYQKKNLDSFKYERIKRRSIKDSDNAAIFSSSCLFVGSLLALAIFTWPVYDHIENSATHADFVESIGKFYSSPSIENKYAIGNSGNHNGTPQKLDITRTYIKGYTKNKLVFEYKITNHRYAKKRAGLILNGKFLKKGAWVHNNDIANVGLYRSNSSIFMTPSNDNKLVRINLCGPNKDNTSPYSSSIENMMNDNEAFVRK